MKEANKTNPCPHCGKPDWCYSLDNLSVCKRDAEPAQGWYKTTKTDSEGSYYYAVEQPKKKEIRPKQTRQWRYTDRQGKVILQVVRIDDGEGNKDYSQERWTGKNFVKGLGKQIKREDIAIYRYQDIRLAIEAGKPIFICEGEPACDTLWNLGLAATTNIGGSGKWRDSDTSDLEGATQVILCPDRDKKGMKHMEKVEENFPNAQWLYAYPESPFWHPERIPATQGLDIADWIEDYQLTADDILKAVEPKRNFDTQPDPKPDEPEELKFNSKLNKKLHQIECRLGNHLSYNEFKKRIEIDYQPICDDLNDQGGAKLFIAETLDMDIGDSDAVAILNRVAKKQPYHPVRDYLEECYSRHGTDTTILENIALRYFGAAEPIHQTYVIKHLIGSVKRIFEPGCKYDSMLILKGEQGAKKSTWLRTLYGDENFTDSVLGTEEKDSLMALNQYWACEYSEFETITTKKDVSQLKSWLARNRDDYRAPYAKTVKPHPRTFVLVGSTNRDDFLKDETGSRRFMIIPVEKDIPIEQLAEERDRIWGAAVSLYRAGVASYLSSVEMKLQKIINENYIQVDPWSDIIAAYLVNETREFIPTCQLLEKAIGLEANQMGSQEFKRVSAIMVQLGFKRHRRRVNGILQWGFVTVPDDDHKIADDLEQAIERTQQEVQHTDPVVPQENTVATCVSWVKAVVADNDPETAGHIKVVLQDICTEKPEFRGAIWENLDAKEREVFRQLTTPKNDSAESESADYENEMLAKDMEKALAKGLKIGDRVRYDLQGLVTEGQLISDIYPGKHEPLAHATIKYDDGTELVVQVRFLEKIDAIATQETEDLTLGKQSKNPEVGSIPRITEQTPGLDDSEVFKNVIAPVESPQKPVIIYDLPIGTIVRHKESGHCAKIFKKGGGLQVQELSGGEPFYWDYLKVEPLEEFAKKLKPGMKLKAKKHADHPFATTSSSKKFGTIETVSLSKLAAIVSTDRHGFIEFNLEAVEVIK